jgi:hypothetical protein
LEKLETENILDVPNGTFITSLRNENQRGSSGVSDAKLETKKNLLPPSSAPPSVRPDFRLPVGGGGKVIETAKLNFYSRKENGKKRSTSIVTESPSYRTTHPGGGRVHLVDDLPREVQGLVRGGRWCRRLRFGLWGCRRLPAAVGWLGRRFLLGGPWRLRTFGMVYVPEGLGAHFAAQPSAPDGSVWSWLRARSPG